MKYLFINEVVGTTSTGIIVADQYRKAIAEGNEAIVAYGRWAENCDDVKTHRIGTDWDVKVHGLMTRLFDCHGLCSTKATERFVSWADRYNPDVVWLHNLHGYYINYEVLFKWIKANPERKYYWTLHDCWSFTGHCSHFTYIKCNQWKTECRKCFQSKEYPACYGLSNTKKNYMRKRIAFGCADNLLIITPSQWLAERVRQSFLGEYPIEVRPNLINQDIFRPTESDFRERYCLKNKVIVLGVANIWNERKGLLDFYKLAEILDNTFQIVLVGLTDKQVRALPQHILGIQRTRNQSHLAEIYSAADFYVNPSIEETYSLTTAEAISCGAYTIVYEDTACEEIVNKAGIDKGIAVKRGVDNIFKTIKSRVKK